MKTKRKNTQVTRRFTMAPEQGAAALLYGSVAEGKKLISMERKGNAVTVIYG
jgi:hypothetical protein